MSTSDVIALCNIAATVLAVTAAPVIALWIGGKLQAREEVRRQQLALLGILLSLRHVPLSPENFRALNMIDAVFADVSPVREAWSKYFAALNDGNLNTPPGFAIRDEKRRDLMIAIVESLGLKLKITTADLLRAYTPATVVEIEHLAIWERIKRREELRAYFIQQGIGFPDFAPPTYPVQQPCPGASPPGEPPALRLQRDA